MHIQPSEPVIAMEVGARSVSSLVEAMGKTAYQGRSLSKAVEIWEVMLRQEGLAIVLGLAGSMSTAGQWRMIRWLIEKRFIDILVSTGANVSEDIVEAMGGAYLRGSATAADKDLLAADLNRYYDVYGKETEYRQMEELLTAYILSLPPESTLSSLEFLHGLGWWLSSRSIPSILAAASRQGVPVFAPALLDSAFGEAYLMAERLGHRIILDQGREFEQFVGIGQRVSDTGVVYIGGGVPKDFTQLMAISLSPYAKDEPVPGRSAILRRTVKEYCYPHRYAIQITTDSPQWGGLSGCTLDEAVSWGKVQDRGQRVTCYCDATIALPLITHALNERVVRRTQPPDFAELFAKAPTSVAAGSQPDR